jgi:hypothetical protein
MEAWTPADPAESGRPQPDAVRAGAEKFLRWLAEIGRAVGKVTNHFLRPRHPASDKRRAESAAEQTGAIASATTLSSASLLTAPVTAAAKILDDQINRVAQIGPDQQEIQRRRDLVRVLFNDFWSGSHDKPAAFVDRLDEAEDYLNERLTACGEFWQLDTETRIMLDLPPRSNFANKRKTAQRL